MAHMKTTIKTIFISAIAVFAAFSCVMYVSCHPDRCHSVVCYNGGTCNGGSCTCAVGYEDASCQTASRLKFLANWGVLNTTTVTEPASFTVSISAGNAITDVTLSNFHDLFTTPISAVIHGDSIIIPIQTVQGKVVQGQGYIYSTSVYGLNGAISMSYTVTDAATFVTVTENEVWNG